MRALDSQTLSITATCFQYHGTGRGTGLKIRWGNTRVGSSPTFGTETIARADWRKVRGAGRTAARGGVQQMNSLEWRMIWIASR